MKKSFQNFFKLEICNCFLKLIYKSQKICHGTDFIDYCPNDFRVYPYDIATQLVCQPATTRASTSNCVDVGEIVHMGIHKSPLGLPPWVMHLLSITTWQEDSFGVLVTQVCSVLYYWEEESISSLVPLLLLQPTSARWGSHDLRVGLIRLTSVPR